VANDLRPLGFCQELATLVETGVATGRSGKECRAMALSSVNNLLTLRAMMLAFKPQRTLEVGLSVGGSALVFAASHRDLGTAAAAQHVAIDPYQSTTWDDAALVSLEAAGLRGYVDFRSAPSALELAALVRTGYQAGLAYVDGSHLFEDVFVDAYFVTRLLALGGVVAFDDCADPHVAKVIAFLRSNGPAGVREIDLSPYRADGKSFRYIAAKLLNRVQMIAFQRVGEVDRSWDAPFSDF
jgi:cephalosporin hydroxylase